MAIATALAAILALLPQEKVPFPPVLPGGKTVATDASDAFLQGPSGLQGDFTVARTAPTIDFAYIPGQDYPGTPWSCWGDGLAANGKYYLSLGDHYAIGGKEGGDSKRSGNAMVFEYDPEAKSFRQLVDLQKLLNVPEGHYTPGKIHSRLDLGDDGWVYFSTHRGSVSASKLGPPRFRGDYIIRAHPATAKAEVVAHGPVPLHSLPNGILDPKRLIFYGGTAGPDSYDGPVHFLAYDVRAGKVLYAGAGGPARCMILAKSGKVYFVPGAGEGKLMRYDPDQPSEPPVALPVSVEIRATTLETPQGMVYAISKGGARLYEFNTKTEQIAEIGKAAVGGQSYVATIDADPTGTYLYYSAGAHGGGEKDGTPVVQFNVKTRTKKVIAFLHPFYKDKYGITITGTFGSAVDPSGERLYFTWNGNRSGGKAWDTVSLSVIHVPVAERPVKGTE